MSIDERTTSAPQHDELSDDALESVAGGVAGLSGIGGLGGDNTIAIARTDLQQSIAQSPIGRLTID